MVVNLFRFLFGFSLLRIDKTAEIFYYRDIPAMNNDVLPPQIDTFMQGLADRIRTARKHIDLSQIELAQQVGVSDKAISSYEVGRAIPPLDILKKISEATQKPMAFFFNEDDVKYQELRGHVEKMQEELDKLRQMMD